MSLSHVFGICSSYITLESLWTPLNFCHVNEHEPCMLLCVTLSNLECICTYKYSSAIKTPVWNHTIAVKCTYWNWNGGGHWSLGLQCCHQNNCTGMWKHKLLCLLHKVPNIALYLCRLVLLSKYVQGLLLFSWNCLCKLESTQKQFELEIWPYGGSLKQIEYCQSNTHWLSNLIFLVRLLSYYSYSMKCKQYWQVCKALF